jgi:hypothetical protein
MTRVVDPNHGALMLWGVSLCPVSMSLLTGRRVTCVSSVAPRGLGCESAYGSRAATPTSFVVMHIDAAVCGDQIH